MDVNTIIFFGVVMVFSLGLGISGFFGNEAEAYSPLSFSTRLLSVGILTALIMIAGLTRPKGETSDCLISYACLLFGVLSLIVGSAVVASRKVSNYWWQLVRRTEQKNDRRYLIFALFILSLGFFFSFFLFYPPFLFIW